MPSKLIAVWGSSGSGKTMTALALAHRLTKLKHRVVVISTDSQTPALPVFLPTASVAASKSIGALLMSNNFAFSNIQDKLHLHPENENLAFMGLTAGENITTYNAFEREKIVKLIKTLHLELDDIIIDCCTQPLLDMMTLTALEIAEVVIRCTTPDNKGTQFLNAQLPLLADTKFKTGQHIRVLSNITPKSPVDALNSLTGGFDFYIPWSDEAYEKMIAGEEIGGFRKRAAWEDNSGFRYDKEMKKLTERVAQNNDATDKSDGHHD